MHILCKYTAIPYAVQNFRNVKMVSHHPIFDLTFPELNDLATRWSYHDEVEQRLLFVAMLRTTECVDFRVPAVPSEATIKKNMELLLRTASWKHTVGDTVSLPGFRVTRDNYTLKSIGAWLFRCGEHKTDWDNKSYNEQIAERVRIQEERITSRLRRGYRDLGRLIELAMSVANVPAAVKPFWSELFTMRPDKLEDKPKIWSADSSQLQAMYSHLVSHVDAATIWGAEVINHCRALIKMNKDGIQYSIMDLPEELRSQTEAAIPSYEKQNYTILPVAGGTNVVRIVTDGRISTRLRSVEDIINSLSVPDQEDITTKFLEAVPLEQKPEPSDYPTRVDYLRANAAWELRRDATNKLNADIKRRNEAMRAKKSLDTDYALGQDDSFDNDPDTEAMKDAARRSSTHE